MHEAACAILHESIVTHGSSVDQFYECLVKLPELIVYFTR